MFAGHVRAEVAGDAATTLRPDAILWRVAEAFNDGLRAVISVAIRAAGGPLELAHRFRLLIYPWTRRRLQRKLKIHSRTPITRRPTVAPSKGSQPATTSGTAGRPKTVPVSPRRLRSLRWTFVEVFARCVRAFGLRRTSLYVFGSHRPDGSLTSLLLQEKGTPPFLSALQAPYRLESHPTARRLAERYGLTALRLWMLALSNPGVLYATNPSSLAALFERLETEWSRASRLVRDFVGGRPDLPAGTRGLALRLCSRGSAERLERIASCPGPLFVSEYLPGTRAYVCWTGGYVEPVLRRLEGLVPSRWRRLPMYSMSTESSETVSHFEGGGARFLPLGPGILYEFLAEGEPDEPQGLLKPGELVAGGVYSMVLSDRYGMRRYQSGDLFRCEGRVGGVPDLTFLRRQGLQYSFTGEKLTAEQVAEALGRLRRVFPALRDGHVACLPSLNGGRDPHYALVRVSDRPHLPGLRRAARLLDRELMRRNLEYAGKRRSGRLHPPAAVQVTREEFVRRLGGAGGAWQSQFKFLPFYTRLWEPAHSARLAQQQEVSKGEPREAEPEPEVVETVHQALDQR